MRLDLELGVARPADSEVGDKITMRADASNPDVVEMYVNGRKQKTIETDSVRATILSICKNAGPNKDVEAVCKRHDVDEVH